MYGHLLEQLRLRKYVSEIACLRILFSIFAAVIDAILDVSFISNVFF